MGLRKCRSLTGKQDGQKILSERSAIVDGPKKPEYRVTEYKVTGQNKRAEVSKVGGLLNSKLKVLVKFTGRLKDFG